MRRKGTNAVIILILVGLGWFAIQFLIKYEKAGTMLIPVEEIAAEEYTEDPSNRSQYYNKYANRTLTLIKKDSSLFDFIFSSDDPSVASITFKDIDLSLYIPIAPTWTKEDSNLEVIALVDREWNRQQVSFTTNSPHLEITGGDGFESNNLLSAELARNCLNAGLWEVLLFTKEDGKKALYYQGWFNFPLGHYKQIFEKMNGVNYWKHWYRLEHWFDPAGKVVNLSKLRTVKTETEARVTRQPNENINLAGEQLRKSGSIPRNETFFPSYIPPGRYSLKDPWDYEYEKIAALEKAYVRKIACPSEDNNENFYEVELFFRSSRDGELNRIIVGGVDLSNLPLLDEREYPQGLYMPMGIGVPPFYQSYTELKSNPPQKTPYYSLLLDNNGRWVNHHKVAIDGSVLHRDLSNPNLLHLYLLSYERYNLVGHFIISSSEELKSSEERD